MHYLTRMIFLVYVKNSRLLDPGIGPIVYHSILFNNGTGKTGAFGGLLVMEKMDTTLRDYLTSCLPVVHSWRRRLFELIRRLSKLGIFCIDMKPARTYKGVCVQG